MAWHDPARPDEHAKCLFVSVRSSHPFESVLIGLLLSGTQVDWPPELKTLHFGVAFNPRPAAPPAPLLGRRSVGVREGLATSRGEARVRVSRNVPGAGAGAGAGVGNSGEKAPAGKWAEFLPAWLEELVFGSHFNQSLVRQLHD